MCDVDPAVLPQRLNNVLVHSGLERAPPMPSAEKSCTTCGDYEFVDCDCHGLGHDRRGSHGGFI